MKTARLVCAAAAVCFALSFAKPVRADNKTATSQISQIKILSKSHANYRLFHGAVWLDYDKAQHNYRWGGKHCGNNTLKGIEVGMLFAAFRYKYPITLDYKVYGEGKAQFRCITAFMLAHR